MTTAQVCEQCGAPMENRRKCDHCQTVYYTGPDTPERTQPDYVLNGFSSISTCTLDFQTSGYPLPYGGWQP